MALELTGTIKHLGKVTMVGQNADYPVQKLFLDISNGDRENYAELQLAGTEKVTMAMDVQVGEKVTVAFNINGRSYDKKDGSGKGFFQSLNVWKITRIKEEPVGLPTGLANLAAEGDDDLPF